MTQAPLDDSQLEYLETLLRRDANAASIQSVSCLDGFLTAVLSVPIMIPAEQLLARIRGGDEQAMQWESEEEAETFLGYLIQHMDDIAERLEQVPEEFQPLFYIAETGMGELMIAEEWCIGYLLGLELAGSPELPANMQDAMDAIALHGMEEEQAALEAMSVEEHQESVKQVRDAALSLHQHWLTKH